MNSHSDLYCLLRANAAGGGVASASKPIVPGSLAQASACGCQSASRPADNRGKAPIPSAGPSHDHMDIFDEVRRLNFPLGHYVVVGSGPLAARRLREPHDIDIVVTPQVFQRCRKRDWKARKQPGRTGQEYLRKGVVELYLEVNCGDFSPATDDLIRRADLIDGVPFANLHDIMRFKAEYKRPKDAEDIITIQRYLRLKEDPKYSGAQFPPR